MKKRDMVYGCRILSAIIVFVIIIPLSLCVFGDLKWKVIIVCVAVIIWNILHKFFKKERIYYSDLWPVPIIVSYLLFGLVNWVELLPFSEIVTEYLLCIALFLLAVIELVIAKKKKGTQS